MNKNPRQSSAAAAAASTSAASRERARPAYGTLASDVEIQARFQRGCLSSTESTEASVKEVIERANALANARRPTEAVRALRTALERVDALSWSLHDTLGMMLRSLGDGEAACLSYEDARACCPVALWPLIHLVGTRKFDGSNDAPIATLEAYLEKDAKLTLDNEVTSHARFCLALAHEACAERLEARGDVCEARRRRRLAWRHADAGNAGWLKVGRASPYDAGKYDALVDRMQAAFPDFATIASLRNEDASAGSRSVFIVGTPRCGSTLAERVLLASGRALPLGEVGTMLRLARHLSAELGASGAEAGGVFDAGEDMGAYCERLVQLPRHEARLKLARLALDYEQTTARLCAMEHCSEPATRALAADARVVYVDKQLDNAIHVALIAAALPAAKIIWCARDARDVGLSQFFHSFEAEHNPRAYDFCYDLKSLARYHASQSRLLRHWLSCVPQLHVLRYERLVSNFDAETRSLFERCALPWDQDKARDFHGDHRGLGVPLTSSVLQTREPLYSRAVDKWRKFEPHLKDFLDALPGDARLDDAWFDETAKSSYSPRPPQSPPPHAPRPDANNCAPSPHTTPRPPQGPPPATHTQTLAAASAPPSNAANAANAANASSAPRAARRTLRLALAARRAREETDVPLPHFALKLTLPAQWLAKSATELERKVLATFALSFHRAHPDAPRVDAENLHLAKDQTAHDLRDLPDDALLHVYYDKAQRIRTETDFESRK